MANYKEVLVSGLKSGLSAIISVTGDFISVKDAPSGTEITSIDSSISSFFVSVSDNTTGEDRSGSITVTPSDGGNAKSITVGQYGASSLSLSPSSLQFDAAGNDITA